MVLIRQEEPKFTIDDVIWVSVRVFHSVDFHRFPRCQLQMVGNQHHPSNIQEYSSDCSSSETTVLRPLCICPLIVCSRIWLTWFTYTTSKLQGIGCNVTLIAPQDFGSNINYIINQWLQTHSIIWGGKKAVWWSTATRLALCVMCASMLLIDNWCSTAAGVRAFALHIHYYFVVL